MKYIHVALLSCLFLSPLSADTKTVSLNDLLLIASQHNPKIIAAQKEAEAASFRILPAQSLPDPMLDLSVKNMGLAAWNIGIDPQSGIGLAIRQEIPFFGKLRLRGEIAKNAYARQKELANKAKWDVLLDLKQAYHDWCYNQKMGEIYAKQKILLRQVLAIALNRYSAGLGSQVEIYKSQIEIARLDEMLIPAQLMAQALQAKINLLLNLAPTHELGQPIVDETAKLTLTLDAIQDLCLNQTPMINEAKWLLAENDAMVALANKEFKPDFSISAAWEYKGQMASMFEAMIGINLPLWPSRRQLPMLREAQSLRESAAASLTQARNEALAMLQEKYLQAKSAEQLLHLYKEQILVQAQLAVDASLANYQVNKLDFMALLSDINNRFAFEIGYYRELANFGKALAALETLTATELNKGME